MKTVTIDCIKMKEESGRRIYEEMKDLTFQEKVDFWKEKHSTVREDLARLGDASDSD